MFQALGAKNVEFKNGTIIGTRANHDYDPWPGSPTVLQGFGFGIYLEHTRKALVYNLNIKEMTGDGIYISNDFQSGTFETIIDSCEISYNRRMGITVASSDKTFIKNTFIHDIGDVDIYEGENAVYANEGQYPKGGIDIEMTNIYHRANLVDIDNTKIERCTAYSIVGNAAAVYGNGRIAVGGNGRAVIIFHFVIHKMNIVEHERSLISYMDTAGTVTAPAAGNGTVVDGNVGIFVDVHNFTVVFPFLEITVNGMSVQVDHNFCVVGNVEGAKLEAFTIAVAKLACLVCVPIGINVNCNGVILFSLHFFGVSRKLHCIVPTFFKGGIIPDQHGVFAFNGGYTKERSLCRLGQGFVCGKCGD